MSTGATSWLWTGILAVGYLIGFRGDFIVLWADGLGVVFLATYALILYRLGRRIFGHRALAALTAALVLLDGRVLWGFFSGMEVGLFTLSMAATAECWMLCRAKATGRRIAALTVSLSCLVLVRPEGRRSARLRARRSSCTRCSAGRLSGSRKLKSFWKACERLQFGFESLKPQCGRVGSSFGRPQIGAAQILLRCRSKNDLVGHVGSGRLNSRRMSATASASG